MNKDMILGFVRHVLTFGGGFVVAQGHIDAAVLEQVVGAIATIIGVVWSAYEKKKK